MHAAFERLKRRSQLACVRGVVALRAARWGTAEPEPAPQPPPPQDPRRRHNYAGQSHVTIESRSKHIIHLPKQHSTHSTVLRSMSSSICCAHKLFILAHLYTGIYTPFSYHHQACFRFFSHKYCTKIILLLVSNKQCIYNSNER